MVRKITLLIIAIIFSLMLTGCVGTNGGINIDVERSHDSNLPYEICKIIFFKDGEVFAIREYHNGKKISAEGDLLLLFKNACEIRIVYKKDDGSKPIGVVYAKNNRVIAENIYKNGSYVRSGKIPDGIVIEKYKDGQINNIFQYKDGKRNGPAISLYPDENLKGLSEYLDDYPTGRTVFYYENGNLKTKFEIKNKVEKYHKEYSIDGELIYQKGEE